MGNFILGVIVGAACFYGWQRYSNRVEVTVKVRPINHRPGMYVYDDGGLVVPPLPIDITVKEP